MLKQLEMIIQADLVNLLGSFDENNNLIGANIDTYLLEKIRVTILNPKKETFIYFI